MTTQVKCSFCNASSFSTILTTSTFKIWNCNSCNIAYTDPAPQLPEYENMDFHSKAEAENLEKLTGIADLPKDWQDLINTQIKMIAENFDKNIEILEIGCGEGILLAGLKDAGFVNVSGIEPSKTGAVRATKRGLNVSNQYFKKEDIQKKYDIILMSHVFEHIEHPIEFLEDLKFVLHPKGAILLTQTNFKGLIPVILKEKWYAWVPEQHFWHFTLNGLKKVFHQNGFKLLASSYTPLVHPHNLLYKLANIRNSLKDQFIVIFQKDVK